MTMPWDLFYTFKPFLPRALQLRIRKAMVRRKRRASRHVWPIDPASARKPIGWSGWPEDKQFAFVLIHDVDTQKGHDTCQQLADIDQSLGFRSSFNFVPERYRNADGLHDHLRKTGFEIGVHGLKHDGKLFRSYKIFKERAGRINRYLAAWQTRGFTAPSMHHNLDWMHLLNIDHSTSTFDTDPFEPQPDAAGTIFPFWVQNRRTDRGFVELPYTLPQDFTLFILMGETSNTLWKQKLDWIAVHGGMALVNTHADYMNFRGTEPGPEEYPVQWYIDFLDYVRKRYAGRYYHAPPGKLAEALRPNLQKMPAGGRGRSASDFGKVPNACAIGRDADPGGLPQERSVIRRRNL